MDAYAPTQLVEISLCARAAKQRLCGGVGCDTSLKECGRQHKQAVWEVGCGDEAVTHVFQ